MEIFAFDAWYLKGLFSGNYVDFVADITTVKFLRVIRDSSIK